MPVEIDEGKVVAFAKQTLGCNCPDEVFEKIESSAIALPGQKQPVARIVIGDRLLIYIVSVPASAIFNMMIEGVVAAGRDDRDRHRYNRFRLVLVTADGGEGRQDAIERFQHLAGQDKKIHLHFVDAPALEGVVDAF